MRDPVRVFVSHYPSSEEDQFTARLIDDLRAAGADVWVDAMSISADEFIHEVGTRQSYGDSRVGDGLILVTSVEAATTSWGERMKQVLAQLRESGRTLTVIAVVTTPMSVLGAMSGEERSVLNSVMEVRADYVVPVSLDYYLAVWRILDALRLIPADAQLLERIGPPPPPPISSPPQEMAWIMDTYSMAEDDYTRERREIYERGERSTHPEETGEPSSSESHASGPGIVLPGEVSASREPTATNEVAEATRSDIPEPAPREHVTFTSHYPREVTPKVWDRLLVFAALDTDAAAREIERLVEEKLSRRRDDYRAATAPTSAPLKRGTRLTITPHLQGFRFDPASVVTEWTDDVQQYEFRLRADDTTPGQAVNGFIAIFEGPLLRGEIPLSVFVRSIRQPPARADHITKTQVAAYRHTFPSYSHKDEPIVRACEAVLLASGDEYLRDVRMLRAGDDWEPKLIKLIDQADVFQLFWSKNAALSQPVEKEWRHALELLPDRPNFIRPI